MKFINETNKNYTNKDIMDSGVALLKSGEGSLVIKDLSTEAKLENLSILLAYKKLLDERFESRIKEYKDNIDEQDFDGTYAVGNQKITFKVKEVINAKAIGLTNEELKKQYNIADSIISIDTKTIATLKKDKLEEAINAGIPEVMDAKNDGKLFFSKDKDKTFTIK